MRRLIVPSLVVVALSLAGAGTTATGRSISIVKATALPNGAVKVTVKIKGWRMYPALAGKKPNKPDGGHWHLFVDGKYNNLSTNPLSGRTLVLKPGKHRIVVALANNDHSPLRPPVKSRAVVVTAFAPKPVKPNPVPTTPPPPPTGGGGYDDY